MSVKGRVVLCAAALLAGASVSSAAVLAGCSKGSAATGGGAAAGSGGAQCAPTGGGGAVTGSGGAVPAPPRTLQTQSLLDNLTALDGGFLWGTQVSDRPGVGLDSDEYVERIAHAAPGLIGMGFYAQSPSYMMNRIEMFVQTTCGADGGDQSTCGVAEIHWPLDGNELDSRWPDAGAIDLCREVLPGSPDAGPCPTEGCMAVPGCANATYLNDLHALAVTLNGLTFDDAGVTKIPVIFRPLHEMNAKGSSHFWDHGYCTPEEYVALFHYVIDTLRSEGVDNILVVWAPSARDVYDAVLQSGMDAGTMDAGTTVTVAAIKQNLSQYYPGDGYVDIMGLDCYDNGSLTPIKDDPTLYVPLKAIVDMASDHGRIPAMSEGHNGAQGSIPGYWTLDYLSAFQDPTLSPLRYAMTWYTVQNDVDAGCDAGCWAPYTPSPAGSSFATMAMAPSVLLAGRKSWYTP